MPSIPAQTAVVTLSITYDPVRLHPPGVWDWPELLSMHGLLSVTKSTGSSVGAGNSSSNSTANEPALSLTDISALVFPPGLDSPLSPHPSDNPLFRVRVLPYDLGVRLANLDPNREHFHFEFFPHLNPPRVELWSARAWAESLTRRLRACSSTSTQTPEKGFHARYAALVVTLRNFIARLARLGHEKSVDAAEQFIKNPALDDVLVVMQAPAEIRNEIHAVRELAADLARTGNSSSSSSSNSQS